MESEHHVNLFYLLLNKLYNGFFFNMILKLLLYIIVTKTLNISYLYCIVLFFFLQQNTNNILLETEELKTVDIVVDNHLNLNSFAVNGPPAIQSSSPQLSTKLSLPWNQNTEFTMLLQRQKQQKQQQQRLQQQHQLNERAVTATPKPSTTNLNDIFITVKTTKMYHDNRLALIIKTWFQLAKEQVSHLLFC